MKIWLSVILSLLILSTAGPVAAKTLYLSDGATLEYKRVWKEGGRIYVLVNRDTLVDFSPAEVDQRKTLKAAGLKKFPRPSARTRSHRPDRERRAVAAPRATAATADPAEKPLVFTDAHSIEAGTPSRGGEGGTDLFSQELLQVYEDLHRAMKSGNVGEVKQHLASRHVSSLGPREMAALEAGISLAPANRTVTGSSMSPDGTGATLRMTARPDRNDSKAAAKGTITFVKEDGAWKVDLESWEIEVN